MLSMLAFVGLLRLERILRSCRLLMMSDVAHLATTGLVGGTHEAFCLPKILEAAQGKAMRFSDRQSQSRASQPPAVPIPFG